MVQLIRKGWNQRGSERSSVSSRPSIALSRTSNAYSSFDSDELDAEGEKTGRESSLGTALRDVAGKSRKPEDKTNDSDDCDEEGKNANPPFKRTISTTYPLQTYYELARQMKEEIEVKDRKPTTKRTSIMITMQYSSSAKTYQQCFLGSDAVAFIQKYLDLESREKAVEIGKEMNERIHCWESVDHDGDCELKDQISSFFRFTDTSKSQEARLKGLIQRRSVATETSSVGDVSNSPDNVSVDTTQKKEKKKEEKTKPSESKLDTSDKQEKTQQNDAESRKKTGSRKIRSQSPRKEKSSDTSSRKTRSLSPRKNGISDNSPSKSEGDNKSFDEKLTSRKPRVARKDRSKSPVRRAASGDTDKKKNEERRNKRNNNDPKASKSVQERSPSNRAMRKTLSMPEEKSPRSSHHSNKKEEQAKKYLEQAHASWGIESEDFTIPPPEPTDTKPGRMASLGVLAIASLETRAGTSVVQSLGREKRKLFSSSNETTQHVRPSLSEERPCIVKENKRAVSLGVLPTASPDRARSASPPKTPQQSKKATRLASLYSPKPGCELSL